MRTSAPLLAPVFRSEKQAQVLAELLLFGEELSVAVLAERTGLVYATVYHEVRRLLDAGILIERRVGNARLVRGNPDSPLVAPVREILRVSAGPAALLKQDLAPVRGIECAFVFGSFAARASGVVGPAPNDIDVMVIGTADAHEVYRVCRAISEQVKRTVNPTVMTPEEASQNTGFLREIAANPIIEIQGDPSSWLSSH